MVIVTDSSLQLSYETIKELNIQVVDYPLFVNGEQYPANISMSREEKEKLCLLIKDELPKRIDRRRNVGARHARTLPKANQDATDSGGNHATLEYDNAS